MHPRVAGLQDLAGEGDRGRPDAGAALAWPVRDEPSTPPAGAEADLRGKQARRDAKLQAEASRNLDPWERYRALTDAVEEGLDLAEMADRKVRFALVVMAGLNVGLFALAAWPGLRELEEAPARGWLGLYLLLYALAGVHSFLQAVEGLRPRAARAAPGAGPRGLRDPEAVLRHDVESYERAWRDVRFDELNGELARRSYGVAVVNREKYVAVGRLYGGLRVLALLFGGLVVMVAALAVLAGGRS